jgi:hypothetical protein
MTINISLELSDVFDLVIDSQKIEYNALQESSRMLQILLNFLILAEIIKDIMLSCYHLRSDNKRSFKVALDFLFCTITRSLDTLMNIRQKQNSKKRILQLISQHHFLNLAALLRRMILQIQFVL